MSENKGESEYSLQYFGFTPECFYEDFSQVIIEEMGCIIKKCIEEVPSLGSATPEKKSKLHQHLLNIHSQWCDRSKSVLLEAEPIIKSVFGIPKNVLLESDTLFKTSYSESDVQLLEKEVADLEEEYAKQLKTISHLEGFNTKLDSYEPFIRQVDEAAKRLEPLVNSINKIKKLKNVVAVHMENKSQFFDSKDDKDNKESEYQYLFKIIEE